jgi:hypothetical protein
MANRSALGTENRKNITERKTKGANTTYEIAFQVPLSC